MDKLLIKELANTLGWLELNKYIESIKEGIKMKLVKEDAEDTKSIAFLQGRYDSLSALQGLVNKFREE